MSDPVIVKFYRAWNAGRDEQILEEHAFTL